METIIDVIFGILIGAALVPVAIGVFIISTLIVGGIFLGIFYLAVKIYYKLF